jgi:signal transduction histidine kinase
VEENKPENPASPKFRAEIITKPFQLAAAVLLVIASVNASFFFAASQLTTPPWLPAFLVISAVLLTGAALFGVYRVATKHREAMQDDTHYSKGLGSKNREMQKQIAELSDEMEKERLLTVQRQSLMINYLDQVTQQLPIGPAERTRLGRAVRDSIQAGEDRASQELSKILIQRVADELPPDDPNLGKLISTLMHARYESIASAYDDLVRKDVRSIDLVANLQRVAQVIVAHRAVVRSPAAPVPILATPGIVEVVLRELLLNAAVYSPSNSQIEVDVGANLDSTQIRIANILMPSTIVSQDWMLPTVRGEGSNSQYANGAGMGLPLVKKLMELVGGEVSLQQAGERLFLTLTFKRG